MEYRRIALNLKMVTLNHIQQKLTGNYAFHCSRNGRIVTTYTTDEDYINEVVPRCNISGIPPSSFLSSWNLLSCKIHDQKIYCHYDDSQIKYLSEAIVTVAKVLNIPPKNRINSLCTRAFAISPKWLVSAVGNCSTIKELNMIWVAA